MREKPDRGRFSSASKVASECKRSSLSRFTSAASLRTKHTRLAHEEKGADFHLVAEHSGASDPFIENYKDMLSVYFFHLEFHRVEECRPASAQKDRRRGGLLRCSDQRDRPTQLATLANATFQDASRIPCPRSFSQLPISHLSALNYSGTWGLPLWRIFPRRDGWLDRRG